MKKTTKILSFVLVFVLLLSATFLTSCKKRAASDDPTPETATNYIIKTEVKDGCIWVTYSSDPETPVNVGALGFGGNTASDASLDYLPLPNGTYGVMVGNAKYLEEISIPETYNGKPVTAILDNAFDGAINLKSITIPDSITIVGDNAFNNCGKLSFTEYESALYLGNKNNPYIVLVKAKDASITSCTVTDKTKAICSNAFYGCSNLLAITIPNNVTNIGAGAFYGCSSLSQINIPEGVDAIGAETFYGCSSLKSVTIPASALTVGTSAFFGCSALETVTFATGSILTDISNAAFSGCSSLKTLEIPKNVVSIGDNKTTTNKTGVFYGCEALTTVTFADGSALKSIGSFAFDNCKSLVNIVLPQGLTVLGHSAFRNSALKEIVIPAGVTQIDQETFYNCDALTTVTIGAGVTKIGHKAFSNCTALASIVIPANVKVIESYAFECKNTPALKSATIAAPAGWSVSKGGATAIPEADMTDPTTAATLIADDYKTYTIYK